MPVLAYPDIQYGTLVKDKSLLRKICKETLWEFNATFGYIVEDSIYVDNVLTRLENRGTYRGRIYKLQYLDGCFNPFVFDVTDLIEDTIKESKDFILRETVAYLKKVQKDYKDRLIPTNYTNCYITNDKRRITSSTHSC